MPNPALDDILDIYLTELKARLGTSVFEVWLYGSQARGDAVEGSDYDLLLVAEGDRSSVKSAAQDAEWACMEAFHVLVSTIVYTPDLWSRVQNSPLGWNIRREGRLIA